MLEVSGLVASAAWGFTEITIFGNTVHSCKLVDRGELVLVDTDGRMDVLTSMSLQTITMFTVFPFFMSAKVYIEGADGPVEGVLDSSGPMNKQKKILTDLQCFVDIRYCLYIDDGTKRHRIQGKKKEFI